LSRGWEPPAPKLHRTFHAAWLAAAADDVHRGWAARHIADKLPGSNAVRARLTALLAAGPDPRVDHELSLQLDKLGAIGGIEDLVSQVRVEIAKQPVRPPTENELAHFAPPVRTADLAALEHSIYANPDDDEPRAVLADLLQARGDPRGELIALQLAVAAGRGTDEGDARIEELVRDHGRSWLGPLHEIAYRAELRRGFLTRLELAGPEGAGAARWESIVEHPLLGTVEDLIPGESTGERYAELIASPAMTALRRIEVFDLAVIRGLERTHARLVHIACPNIYAVGARFEDVVLPACARFETLRSIACRLEEVTYVMRSPIAARLTTLTVVGEVTATLAFWRNFRRSIELVIAPHARLVGCTREDVEGRGSIRARREDNRVIIRVAGPWATAICEYQSLLPADRLELVEPITAAVAARIDQLAGKVEIVRIPRERQAGIIGAIAK
ncbi:MAG: TIGR02996 domain-containing protein, partial [Deltaproteobacteria bacterium]|nr:TIGR02996 domain-containing protein [Deltaproteobacteria bacterium]